MSEPDCSVKLSGRAVTVGAINYQHIAKSLA